MQLQDSFKTAGGEAKQSIAYQHATGIPTLTAAMREVVHYKQSSDSTCSSAIEVQPYQMEGSQCTPPTEDKGSSPKCMPCQLDELPFLLQGHARPIVDGEHDQLGFDFLYIQPDWLWH